jgi:AcrR family transcriptional regulator
VLQAAAEHFASEDYDQITVANIARSADASPSTVYGLFDGIDDIAVQLLLAQGEQALGEAVWSAPPGLEAVTERLTWVAEQLAARSRYLAPYTAKLATGATPPHDALLGAVRDAVATGIERGALRTDLDRERTAHALLVLTISSLHAEPANGPAGAVRHATGLIYPGLTPAA